MIKQKRGKYRKAVFIPCYYIDKNGNIFYLILKRKLHWIGFEFPKGGIEEKETNLEIAKREVKEETGQNPILIKNHKIKGSYKYPKIFADRPGIIGQTYHLFSAQLKSKKIKIDKTEHSDYLWLDYKEALKKLTFKEQKKCLKFVNKYLMKQKIK
ncbi:MAG: NUDIX domain-containing protein [Candidatus Pacearchaeota archaeon]